MPYTASTVPDYVPDTKAARWAEFQSLIHRDGFRHTLSIRDGDGNITGYSYAYRWTTPGTPTLSEEGAFVVRERNVPAPGA